MPATDAGSGSVIAAPGSQVGTSEATPEDFTEALGKVTILVVIYQPKSELDELMLEQASAAAGAVKDLKVFLIEAGDYEYFADLPEKLGLFGTPSVAVINRAGIIENFWTGYVDSALIKRSLLIADTVENPKVTPSDAPPVKTNFDEAAADANSATPEAATAGA